MICPNCGTENRPGASFCTGCGDSLDTKTAVIPEQEWPDYSAPSGEESSFALIAQDGTRHPITGPKITIGREDCDILLPQDELVSRKHAEIRRQGDELVLTDLDSSNGTFVNGDRLQAPHTLCAGDTIQVGSTKLTLQGAGKAPPTRSISESQWQAPPSPQSPEPVPVPQQPPKQATKDKSLAYILEFILLGLGWLYVGETGTGIAILASWVIVGLGIGITIDVATGGFGCLCTVPLSIMAYAFSLNRLSKYMNDRPHTFK